MTNLDNTSNINAIKSAKRCVQTHALHTLLDTQKLALQFAAKNPVGSMWLLGDLGAGKTTFTRFFLQALGHGGMVKSPTYTIVEPYYINEKSIYHADLYRLDDAEELDFIGFFDYFAPKNLVIIEWPSRAQDLLPIPNHIIEFRLENNIRIATVYE